MADALQRMEVKLPFYITSAVPDDKIKRFVAVLEIIEYASMCAEDNRRLVSENMRLRGLILEGVEKMAVNNENFSNG